jgi:RNA polymerase sigma-70 factor (ECF subfamily)
MAGQPRRTHYNNEIKTLHVILACNFQNPPGLCSLDPAGRDHNVPELEFNEEDVLTRASQGDRDAFGLLYERYLDRIFNYVYYRTGNLHDAEDLTARVFQRAMNHIQNYTDRGVPFSAWLYRIAHNLVANWHRDRSRRQEIPINDVPVLPSKGDHPERNLVRSQEQDSLLRLIRRLPGERQNLLILKFVENMSNAEIGSIMGRSEGAVKSLYHRTLLALRDQLGDQSINLDNE